MIFSCLEKWLDDSGRLGSQLLCLLAGDHVRDARARNDGFWFQVLGLALRQEGP